MHPSLRISEEWHLDNFNFENKPVLSYFLPENELYDLYKIYQKASLIPKNLSDEDYFSIAHFFSRKIQREVKKLSENLEILSDNQTRLSAVFIQNLPKLVYKPEEIITAELISLSFALIIGQPFQYKQQNNAKLVARISPLEGFESTQSGLSKNHFGWHTDDRIFSSEFRTEWIQLMGIHNPSEVKTLISPIDEITQNLPHNILSILMENRYEVKMPTSFGFKKNIWSEPISLISKNKMGFYEVGVPTYNVRTVDINDFEAKKAFKYFLDIIKNSEQSFIINSDSLLIINNNRLLHSRTEIEGERLILRTYIRNNLDDLRAKSNSNGNVFDARFLI